MCSEKQLLANRLNAIQSTGPKTEEGKLRASQNALKHGLCTSSLLPTESQQAYDQFCQDIQRSLDPHGAMEEMLVERIANLTWRLRRLPAAEAEIFNQLDDARQDKATQAHQFEYRYRTRLKNPPPPPSIPPKTSSQHLALAFINQDDRTNPFSRLQKYESHLQRSLSRCLNELKDLQKHRPDRPDQSPADHQYATTSDQPQPTNQSHPAPILQIEPKPILESGDFPPIPYPKPLAPAFSEDQCEFQQPRITTPP